MKKAAIVLLVLAIAIGAAGYWLSGNIDHMVRDAIASYGSAMTRAKVSVGDVAISTTSGKGSIRRLEIGNPSGFKTSHALKVERIDIAIDVGTIAKDVIIIHSIIIDGPDVIYEKGEGTTNFDAIQKNIAAYLGPTDKGKKDTGPKLIVEALTISNTKAHASAAFMGGKTLTVPLPDISLRNVGKSRGGITPGELGQEIAAALKSKLTGSVNFDRLLKSTGQALDKAGDSIKGLFK
ncbi:MAG: hypothetical protein HZA63_07705 [Rhodocyclales bacterium]|nr:hypothetical protein [Rhodocyclales bacterium]